MKIYIQGSALMLGLGLLFSGCGSGSSSSGNTNQGQEEVQDEVDDTAQTASFSADVSAAFNQNEDDEPISPKDINDESTSFDSLIND